MHPAHRFDYDPRLAHRRMADERPTQGEQSKDDRGRRALLSRRWLRSKSFRTGDHENLDDFLRSGFSRMGLRYVFALLLGHRRSWPPEGLPAFCSDREQRGFHLHGRKHRAVAPVGQHLYEEHGWGLGASGASPPCRRGSGRRVAGFVLDVSEQNLHQSLSTRVLIFALSASSELSPRIRHRSRIAFSAWPL
jgi:hypothetical protein